MTSLTFDRYCDEIVTQTERLTAHVRDADTTAPVPSCPGWNLGQLLRHVGGDHRWAQEVVRTGDARPFPEDLSAYTHEKESVLTPWLTEGAASLSAALRSAGPDARVWTPADDRDSASFWARRMTYETAVHRADAALVTGAEFTLDDDLAADAVQEWLEFSTVSEAFAPRPDLPGLLGPDRTLGFRTTDGGAWFVDLTGDRPAWRPGSGDATVAVHGPVTDLLLFLYRRPAPAVQVQGDTALLDLWLTRTGFWLEA
ncbi:maleylpyruvate isomerase family mycothiol-dependent enzyme [Streptomyces sp. NPDC049627]|uniref:maleylpyruvate isomerase family mycothiol-dependent enzyme n=1 Tax=Streptomyces sp. NPDC049627 TaxID=3365595 RepID=UPI0037AD202E